MNKIIPSLATLVLLTSLSTPSIAAVESQKDIMEAAASACEDMVEAVATGGMPAAQPKINDLKAALKKAHGFLKADVAKQLETDADEITKLAAGSSTTELSLKAVEAFKDIVNASDWKRSAAPKDISMLDYSGYKLGILASTANTDWAAAAKTADEAHAAWQTLLPKFKSQNLKELAQAIDAGALDAVKRKDAAGLQFASKLQLVSIDIIEGSFAKPKL